MAFYTYPKNVPLPGGRTLGFRRDKGYYAKAAGRVPARRAAPNPYPQLTEQEIAQRAAGDVLPGITGAATALTEALVGRATRSSNEISARSRAIQAALAPYVGGAGSIYGQAAGSQQALGDAIRSAIGGTGHALQADLAQALQGIQAPQQAVTQIAGGQGQAAEGAAGAAGALSSADLARLRGEGAAATNYAAGLPRIAGLAAEGQRRGVLSEAANTLTEKLAELYAKQPGLVSEAAAGYRTQNARNAAQASREAYQRATLAERSSYHQQTLRERAQSQASLDTYRGGILGLRGQSQQSTDAYRAASLRLRGRSLDQQASHWASRFGFDQYKFATQEKRLAKSPKKGGVGAATRQRWTSLAYESAKAGIQGYIDTNKDSKTYGKRIWPRDPDGNKLKPVQVMKDLMGHGIPFSIAVRAVAQFYPPAKAWYNTRPKAQAAADGGSLQGVLRQAGFRGDALRTAYAVALAESGGRPTAHNPNVNTGDNSYGLFQINMLGDMGPARLRQFGLSSNEDLYDPLTNARVAYLMSGGGRDWSPWTTYTSGAYRRYI